jgi:hypothetical protein
MKRKQFRVRSRLALGSVILALTGGATWATTPGDGPLLSILAPAFNSTQPGATVSVRVHFGTQAIQSTFHAQMDGTEISNLFAPTGHCDLLGHCDMQADLPAQMLLAGTNIVTASVSGPNESAAVDRTSFQFTGPSTQGAPVAHMIPAVSVKSVNLPANADANQTSSYQILVGPGPGFQQRVYSAHGLSCGAGINSMQVLVLQPQTLAPESRVGSGSGQSCFGNATELANFLKGLPKNDVVIMNSFLGTMSNVDTTAIGGTRYTNSTPYYNAIGVVGALQGSAYESYQPNASHTPRQGRDHLPPLVGSLMLDSAQRYFFVPSSYPELKVTPGERSSDSCAHVQYGTTNLSGCVERDSAGGFQIIAIDRLSGAVTDHYSLPTNATDPARARTAISDFAFLLNGYYKSNDLLIVTTVGTPIGIHAPVSHSLYDAINTYGGNAYRLPQLTSSNSSYVLISSRDPGFVSQHLAVQSFEPGTGTSYGPVHVLLAKNRSNQFVPAVSAQDQKLKEPFGFEWSEILFQQPQAWPAWTPAQQKAYEDLTSSDNHYGKVRRALGCGGGGTCQPIRSYYVGGIGTSGTTPAVLSIPYGSLTYYPNAGYGDKDFEYVVDQLETEQGWLNNVYTNYAQFTAISSSAQDNLQQQLSNVASSIEQSLYEGAPNYALTVQRLNQGSAVAGLFSVLPGVGPAAGAVGALLNAAAAFTPVGESPIPEKYSVTLAQLRNKTATLSRDMQASTVTAFAGVVQDYGKLATIGGGIGSQEPPWYMCVTCIGSNIPFASLPMFALSAKQSFYKTLLPTAYSSDVFVQKKSPDPRNYGTWTLMFDSHACYRPYGNSKPGDSWSFPSINLPSTWDVFIITQTKTGVYPGTSLKTLSFPSQSLLDQMFGAPQFTVDPPDDYKLTGGAGLTHDDMMPTSMGGYLDRRAGYLATGTNNNQCPAY